MSNSASLEARTTDSLDQGQYLTQRVQDQISWYEKRSVWNQRWFKRLRTIEIVAAALIPFLTVIPDISVMKYIVGSLGILVTITAGILALFQFQERWTDYRATSESLKREQYLFLTKTEPYAGDDAFPVFVQRVETLISKEIGNWTQSLVSSGKKDEKGT